MAMHPRFVSLARETVDQKTLLSTLVRQNPTFVPDGLGGETVGSTSPVTMSCALYPKTELMLKAGQATVQKDEFDCCIPFDQILRIDERVTIDGHGYDVLYAHEEPVDSARVVDSVVRKYVVHLVQ